MRESLPPDACAPFMDEIKKREKQRKERARKVFLFSMITIHGLFFLIFFRYQPLSGFACILLSVFNLIRDSK